MTFDDKRKFQGEDASQDQMMASRARNRTVMLTPEVTGQVRALLQTGEGETNADKTQSEDVGFTSPREMHFGGSKESVRTQNPTMVVDRGGVVDRGVGGIDRGISDRSTVDRATVDIASVDRSSLERGAGNPTAEFRSIKNFSFQQEENSTKESDLGFSSLATSQKESILFGGSQGDSSLKNNTDIFDQRKERGTREIRKNNLTFEGKIEKSNNERGTLEVRREKSFLDLHERSEKGGTLTTSRVNTSELQRHSKPESQGTQLHQRPSSNFNEERGILVQEKVKQQISSARIVGFLVSFDEMEGGEVFELRVGRWLVSSNPMNQKDTIVIEDGSISALHAVVKVFAKGEVQILDQLSENGTGILKQGGANESDASQGVISLVHGDVVRFGKRYFVYCAVPKINIAG